MQTNKSIDPKGMSQLLEHRKVKQLIHKAKRLADIDALLPAVLPAELIGHCRAMNITANSLTLEVDSAAHAFPLRYQSEQVLSQLQQHPICAHITQLLHRIRPAQPIPPPAKPPVPPQPLSSDNAQLIADVAQDITHDKLRMALLRLAKRN